MNNVHFKTSFPEALSLHSWALKQTNDFSFSFTAQTDEDRVENAVREEWAKFIGCMKKEDAFTVEIISEFLPFVQQYGF